MSAFAPILQGFFTDKLIRNATPARTPSPPIATPAGCCCDSPRARTATAPSSLDIAEMDAELVTAFLTHLETERGNTAATRNARLAAVRSLFRYAALHAPDHAAHISRVLAIPPKRCDRAMVCFLTAAEIDALLAAPDRATWLGRRDHALLLLGLPDRATGLRADRLHPQRHSPRHRRARPLPRQRPQGPRTPLTRHTVAVSAGLARRTRRRPRRSAVRDPAPAAASPRRRRAKLVAKHATTAAAHLPVTRRQDRSPRTPCATPRDGPAARRRRHLVIALWLGHEDPSLDAGLPARRHEPQGGGSCPHPPPTSRPGRYRAPDALLAFLDNL